MPKRSLFARIYRPIFWGMCLVFLIIITLLSYIYVESYIQKQTIILDAQIDQLVHMSHLISEDIDYVSHRIQRHIRSRDIAVDMKAVQPFIMHVGEGSPYIYGLAYAVNPRFLKKGIYIYQNPQGQIVVQHMKEIYQKHGDHYYTRPWFRYVMKYKKPIANTPQANWFGASDNMMTYAFPIMNKQHQVLAVGAADVSMHTFFSRFLESALANKALNVYYMSLPYDDNKPHATYYKLDSMRKHEMQKFSFPFLRGIHLKGQHNWVHYHGRLYREVSFVKGGLNFLIEINLIPMLVSLVIVVIWITIIGVFMMWLTALLMRRRIAMITEPITQLAIQTTELLSGDLYKSIAMPENLQVKEGIILYEAFERMRQEVIKLIEQEKESQSIKSQLNLAAKVQSAFFLLGPTPYTTMQVDRYAIATYFKPGNYISGDIYDVIEQDQSIYLFLGDATGKDIAASIFSVFLLTRFKILVKDGASPKTILGQLNNYLCSIDTDSMFMSCVCVQIDLVSHQICFANAGHPLPIVVADGKVVSYPYSHDVVLGIVPDYDYSEVQLESQHVNSFTIFSDGITEAESEMGEEFGVERLQQTLAKDALHSAGSSLADMIETVEAFENSAAQQDDKTVIHLHRL